MNETMLPDMDPRDIRHIRIYRNRRAEGRLVRRSITIALWAIGMLCAAGLVEWFFVGRPL